MDYIAQNINVLISKSDFKISDLAKEMGVTKQTVYNIKNGQVTIDNLIKLAEILQVPVSEFFKRQKDTASKVSEINEAYENKNTLINLLNDQIQIKDKQIFELLGHIRWLEKNFELRNDNQQLQENV